MSNPRIYQQQSFSIGDTVTLSEDAFGHTIRVLRLKSGDSLTLFNGEFNNGLLGDYQAELTDVNKKFTQKRNLGRFADLRLKWDGHEKRYGAHFYISKSVVRNAINFFAQSITTVWALATLETNSFALGLDRVRGSVFV